MGIRNGAGILKRYDHEKICFLSAAPAGTGFAGGVREGGEEEETMEPIVPIENPGTLLGTWAWVKTYSGVCEETPESTGKYCTLQLCNDSSWVYAENGSVTKGDKFTVGGGFWHDIYDTRHSFDSICFYQSKRLLRTHCYARVNNEMVFYNAIRGIVGGNSTCWVYIKEN